MAYYIRQLKDNQGNIILPASRAEGIFFSDNTKLSSIMSATSGVVNKAMGDKNGKDIATYLANASIDDHKLTLTKGDGTPVEINIPDNDTTYEEATTSTAGLMSSADKTKLDGIASGANKTTVDTALSTSSTNPVRNSVVTNALNKKASTSHSHSAATTSTAGFMSASDKTLLNSLSNSVIVDTSWGSSVSDIP